MKRMCPVLTVALSLCVSSRTVAQQSSVVPQPLSIEGASTHVYKSIGGTELRLHVFSPPNHASSAKRPAIVFFFGGGWTNGTIRQFLPQSQHFVSRGMVAILADYRVFGRHQTSPFESMADAKSAIRWARLHAAELGIDPDRIVASGGSAGGHLALSAAVFGSLDEPGENLAVSSKPNALILFNPAVDTSGAQRFGARALEGSPFHHLRRDLPPAIIFHGKSDKIVPYEHVERFCAKARELGNRCELFGYEEAGHGFFNLHNNDGKWHRETLSEADRFLTAIGYLRQPSPSRSSE